MQHRRNVLSLSPPISALLTLSMRVVPGFARFISIAAGALLACEGQFSPEPPVNGGGRGSRPELRPDEQDAPRRRPDAGAAGASGAMAGEGGARASSDPDDRQPADAGSLTSGEPGSSGGPFCDAVTEVLLPRCGGGSCHSNPNARIGDFAAGRAEAESFVDVPSVRNASCGFVIDSREPSQSLLLRKLVGDYPIPTCGGPMPVSGGDLTDEQIDCMASWLEQFRVE